MENSNIRDPPTASFVEPTAPPSAMRPPGYKLDQWNREQWTWDDGIFSAWAGISLAGVCYVPIAAVVALIGELVLTGRSVLFEEPHTLLCGAVSLLFVSLLSGIAMFTVGGILLLVASVPVLYLELHRHAVFFGVLVGGTAGGICSLFLYGLGDSGSTLSDQIRFFLLLPGLATLCGQVGGGWGICSRRPKQPVESRPLRFRLQGALLFTTWLAAFFGIARWGFEEDTTWFSPLLVWMVFQAGTAWLVMQMLAWRGLRTSRVGTASQPPVE